MRLLKNPRLPGLGGQATISDYSDFERTITAMTDKSFIAAIFILIAAISKEDFFNTLL